MSKTIKTILEVDCEGELHEATIVLEENQSGGLHIKPNETDLEGDRKQGPYAQFNNLIQNYQKPFKTEAVRERVRKIFKFIAEDTNNCPCDNQPIGEDFSVSLIRLNKNH